MLRGPYLTTEVSEFSRADATILASLGFPSPGCYLLSRTGEGFDYVGRSDTDVHAHISRSVLEDTAYRFCWIEYTPSAQEAYLQECRYYHGFSPPDNRYHPSAPAGSDENCPVCSRSWEIPYRRLLALLK